MDRELRNVSGREDFSDRPDRVRVPALVPLECRSFRPLISPLAPHGPLRHPQAAATGRRRCSAVQRAFGRQHRDRSRLARVRDARGRRGPLVHRACGANGAARGPARDNRWPGREDGRLTKLLQTREKRARAHLARVNGELQLRSLRMNEARRFVWANLSGTAPPGTPLPPVPLGGVLPDQKGGAEAIGL